jgi:2,4-dienoyl-CoA reductase-like NADH-dependent reductase (Old Yellow Enzyme family)
MNENQTTLRRNALTQPLTLRSGITLPNRVAKAATSEHLADRRGAPTNQLITAYRALALSGAGLLISGNVMVDGAALEAPRNVVIEDGRHREQLRRWAAVTEGTDAKFILQLSHPGRQTMRGNRLPGRRQDVVGPSEVPLAVGAGGLFRAPRALSEVEIKAIITRFARAAQIADDAGCSTNSSRRWSTSAPTIGAARWRTVCGCSLRRCARSGRRLLLGSSSRSN